MPEERFAAAQEQLEKALSGRGDLGERYRTWLGTQVVDPGLVERAAAVFADDLRERTRERFGLPDGETVSFESVQNEPWSGFNYYLGNRHSRVVVNTDLPIHSLDLPDLVAHEMYPGHHTEHAWKEALLVDGEGRLEESLFLTGTPQAIVSEGIATMARETIYGEDGEEIAAQTLAGLGIPAEADTARAVHAFRRAIDGLSVNGAYLLNEEGRPADEVRAYAERWSLLPRERVEKWLSFLTHPTWRAYISSYSSGYELCRAFVGDDPSRFRLLLTEQLTTSDLVAKGGSREA
ncbi:MAG TPA: hypothetical protein VFA56_12995 [Gaiellaceae bacterium]|nr:hypothetical protein [Gaiellaceae bacterium]